MKIGQICLLLLLFSSCLSKRIPRAMVPRKDEVAHKVVATIPEPAVILPLSELAKMTPVSAVYNEYKAEAVLTLPAPVANVALANQVAAQKQMLKKQAIPQAKKKMVQMDAKIAKSISRSKLELKKTLISGPSQFDSRIEPHALDLKIPWQKKIHDNSLAIGIIVEKDKIHAVTDSTFELEANLTLQTRYKLCTDEAFASQPVIGIGTAFIIGKHTMITAGHVFTEPLSNYVVVFGFEMLKEKGKFNSVISSSNIYHPQKTNHKDIDLDLTVFEVEEEITRPALAVAWESNPVVDTEIYMIGHPSGLPEKVALNAEIQESDHPLYFYTSLDAFQGNSGSPVFSMATHQVIGVLVSGAVDYVWNGSCNKSSLCQTPYCNGEKVMKISTLSAYVGL